LSLDKLQARRILESIQRLSAFASLHFLRREPECLIDGVRIRVAEG
jgi:hypothetical protein